jgi:hypothetical protein
VRPYRALGELWRMVSRSAFVQLRHRYDLLVLVILGLALFFVSPPLLVAARLFEGLAATGEGPSIPWGWTLPAALAAWGLQTIALYPAVRHHRVPPPFATTLPLAALLYALMTLSSGWNHLRGRGAAWKGRSYGGSTRLLRR